MAPSQTTSWNLVQRAVNGAAEGRERFAEVYSEPIRAYLGNRWRGQAQHRDLDDAVQDVFVECFRPGGALARLDVEKCSSFRAFLFGVVRNVALRFEQRRARQQRRQPQAQDLDALPHGADTLSHHFDRAWAHNLLRVAIQTLAAEAQRDGPEAVRRLQILRARFQDGVPIRDLARQWGEDATQLHRQFARAKRDFERVLRQLLAPRPDAAAAELDQEIDFLLSLLRRS